MKWKTRVAGLRGYQSLVRELGGDPLQFTRACGIPDGLLDDHDAMLPYRQLIHLLERTASSLDTPDFGLRLANTQDIGVLGPLAVAMQHSATVEEAMRCAAKYLFVQSPALTFRIEKLPNALRLSIRVNLSNMPYKAMPQAMDLAFGVMHGVLNFLARECYSPIRVELSHAPPGDPSVYTAYFGTPVVFNCETSGLFVTKDTFSASVSYRSEELHQLAISYLEVQLPTADGLLAGRVERAVRRLLGTGKCNRDTIASAMAMHPRTLQRHLEQEGETFNGIRDRVRRERAEDYLYNTNVALAQVANMIGYTEQAALNRSCQRWFGAPPGTLRKRQAQTSPATVSKSGKSL